MQNFPGILSWLALASMVLFAVRFRAKQNRGTADGSIVGGAISWPKAFWLANAIIGWYLVPFVFWFDASTEGPMRSLLAAHLASWWIRAPIELWMIYRLYNWTPVYGILHDLAHGTLMAAGLAWACAKIGWEAILASPALGWTVGYSVLISFSMIAEAVFAALFMTTRGEGQNKIYFADDSAQFRLINRLTLGVCVTVYAFWLALAIGLTWGS